MTETAQLPLQGILVLDFSQFLSGPSASLRLADLGARVIKIERPGTGDICRHHYVSATALDGESTLFHAINRNKESLVADLQDEADRSRVLSLVQKADVVMHNFRPGVMERLGLAYDDLAAMNSKVIYGEISGYGDSGPWAAKPGQDLLVQALSGFTWLSGNADKGPLPVGLAIADIYAGAHLVQGILACLVRRGSSGQGGRVQVSMLESMLDFQFEPLTVYFQDGGHEARRSIRNNAHAYLGAPYGLYQTADGYMALAMASIPALGELLECEPLMQYEEPAEAYEQREDIKAILADHLVQQTTADWLAVLEPADIWCADVLDWNSLRQHDAYRLVGMEQSVERGNGIRYQTTRCPIRINGQRLCAGRGSPALGEHTQAIAREFEV